MNLFERDIAVDMGTSSTLLFEQGKGVVAREPTVVAVDKFSGKILKIGQDAQKMLGRTPANIVAIHPVSAGVVSDYEITAQMLRELIGRITSFSLFKPCVLACVPSSITGVEERAVIDAAIEAGARKVYLLETAIATAMGAGVDISKADGHMVIDIGGGTTEVAIVSGGGVVECESHGGGTQTQHRLCDPAAGHQLRGGQRQRSDQWPAEDGQGQFHGIDRSLCGTDEPDPGDHSRGPGAYAAPAGGRSG